MNPMRPDLGFCERHDAPLERVPCPDGKPGCAVLHVGCRSCMGESAKPSEAGSRDPLTLSSIAARVAELERTMPAEKDLPDQPGWWARNRFDRVEWYEVIRMTTFEPLGLLHLRRRARMPRAGREGQRPDDEVVRPRRAQWSER